MIESCRRSLSLEATHGSHAPYGLGNRNRDVGDRRRRERIVGRSINSIYTPFRPLSATAFRRRPRRIFPRRRDPPVDRASRRVRSARRAAATSSQFGPGGEVDLRAGRSESSAVVIASRTSAASAAISASGASKTSSSWIWRSIRACEPVVAEPAVDGEHRPLDQVGGRALDHGVDGGPLGEVAVPAGRVLDPVDRPAAAEDRLDPARSPGRLRASG